jgi:ribosomal protein S18 acetylase RimI-like enzyme
VTPIRLVRPLAASEPAPIWPAGIRLVPFSPEDARAVHSLLEAGYAKGGGGVTAFDQWWPGIESDSEYDPDLCLLAKAEDGTPVGFCLIWSSAFIKDLVVAAAWRKHGLGTALLGEAFHRLAARGAREVALKVEADNPSGAERLYRALGFRG